MLKIKKNFFESDYKKYGNRAQREYPNTELISFIKTKIKKKRGAKKIKILELGCGTGANLWMLSKEKLISYGIDNSKTAIKICKKILDEKKLVAKLFLGSMTNLPFKNNYFDVIVDIVSMQNFSYYNHQITWRSIYKCLKPGGYFFSFHLGQNSTSFKELKKNKKRLIDKSTLRNIPKKYPLAHKGEVCFLKPIQVFKEFSKIGFKKTGIEKTTRTYNSVNHKIEYLIITAKK